MPESRESEASYLIVEAAVSDLIEEGITLCVEHIEIDATDKEQARFPRDHPARNGLPYIINGYHNMPTIRTCKFRKMKGGRTNEYKRALAEVVGRDTEWLCMQGL